MSKKDIALLAAMTMAMAGTPSLYGGLQRAPRRQKVSKCSECPEFGRKCLTRNGEMKPCSKYR